MRVLYLLDNSATQRISRSAEVAAAVGALLDSGVLASCLPQLLEEGYSARSASDHATILDLNARAKVFLPPVSEVADRALDLQRGLFAAGKGRAVGVSDLQIAATALVHSGRSQQVIVVHHDSDFDHVAEIEPEFRAHWIVPRE